MTDIMFTCAPQIAAVSSWIDNFPALKTLTPPIITGSVTAFMASLAYFVSRSQREIAANKYNLDLFEKRYPEYEKFLEAFRSAREEEELAWSTIDAVRKNKTLINKCSRMFSGINMYCESLIELPDEIDIKKKDQLPYLDQDLDEFERFLDGDDTDKLDETIKSTLCHITNAKNNNDVLSENSHRHYLSKLWALKLNFKDQKALRDRNLEKINEIDYEIDELKNRIKASLISILDSMEAQLTLSHAPYTR